MRHALCTSALILSLTPIQAALAQGEQHEGGMFTGFFNPDWENDFSVTIGTKVWMNEWQIDRFFFGGALIPVGAVAFDVVTTNTAPDTQISDIEPTPIPQLAIKYKQLYVTASYYAKTDFDFPTVGQSGTATFRDAAGNTTFFSNRTAQTTTTGERWEWDAAVGWNIHPYVAILVGYKEVNIDSGGTVTGTDTFRDGAGNLVANPFPSTTFSSEFKFSGPTLGIAGSVPIAQTGFGIYASYGHGFMDADIKDITVSPQFSESSATFDADYDVAELGFSYTHGTKGLLPYLPLSAATAYAGYRYQTIGTNIPDPLGDRRDVTQGFAAGVNLSF